MNEVLTPSGSGPRSSSADLVAQLVLLCLVSVLVALETRWPAGLLLITVGGVTFADAWGAGMGRQAGGTGLRKTSPLLWSVFVELFPLVVLPTYFFNRLPAREGRRFLWRLLIVLTGAVYLLSFVMPLSVLVGPFD